MKLVLAGLTILTVVFSITAGAEEPPSQEAILPANSRFIDLDGDGFNDNIPDVNNDGIPDFSVEMTQESRVISPSGESDIFGSLMNDVFLPELKLPYSQKFNRLKYCARDLCKSRGGFGSDEAFGPGNGIGQGALSGHCLGGICHF